MKIFISILFSVLTVNLSAQAVHGIVFQDGNANKKHEEKEPGLPSIRISDGYNVVQTDANGTFAITPDPKARFLFATVPSGYKASTKFYMKIDPNADSFAIGLTPDETQHNDKLDFIQITDTETPLYGPWIDNVRAYADNNNMPLIMHTGDICYEPGMRFHAQQVNSELMGRPVYYAVGNHDLVKGEYGEKLFEDLFGPTYYSFEAGPAYFVVTPMWGGDFAPSYTKDQVIAWLKKDLALKDKSKPLIFINHDFSIGPDFVLKGEKEQIDLKQYNLKAWLFGHWHNNYVFKRPKLGVTVISTNAPNKGGIDHAAGQFLHIEINKNGVNKITPIYTNLRSRIHLLHPVASTKNVRFLANVYDSERQVKKVQVWGLDNQGNKLFETNLEPKTDWAWESTAAISGANGMVEALIDVRYGNGEHEIRKQEVYRDSKGFELKWSHNIGSNIWKVQPLIVEDKVLSASFDDGANERSAIVAMDRKSGKRLWSFKTENSVKQKLHYADGIVLATDVAGNVYALNVQTGEVVWEKNISGGRLPSYVTGGVLYDNVYYTGYGNYLSALDRGTGKEIWRNTEWNGGEAMPGEMLATENILFTGANWNSLFAHNRKTGKLLWKKEDEGLRFRSGGVAVEGSKVYAPGLNSLLVLDAVSGRTLRKKEYNHEFKVMASPTVLQNMLILPNSTEGVSAYDKQSLERVWNFKTQEAMVYTSSYTTPDQHKLVSTVESTVQQWNEGLIFGASDGYLYFLDAAGQLLNKYYFGAPLLADVTTAGDEIYVADFAGNVYCLHYN